MWNIDEFPPSEELESKDILRQCVASTRVLAELKGASLSIPNQGILINTLSLQEAKDSSAIENIITTHDELYKHELFPDIVYNLAAKEVHDYTSALRAGFDRIGREGVIARSTILAIQAALEKNDAGFRVLPGTELKNDATGETVYVPPQKADYVERLMARLVEFLNEETGRPFDPLVRMALIHHQFESIHPFYDGNGRTGRILNALYLVKTGLLDIPVLYLSRYLIQTKSEYYRLLQNVRDSGDWEPWILYILVAVEKTSRSTLRQIEAIKIALMDYKHRIREAFPKMYSQDLINNLFNHPYTKIDFLRKDLRIGRLTATKYLDALADAGFLSKQKIGRSNYYVNNSLFPILTMEEKD
jgi:Fic family protein